MFMIDILKSNKAKKYNFFRPVYNLSIQNQFHPNSKTNSNPKMIGVNFPCETTLSVVSWEDPQSVASSWCQSVKTGHLAEQQIVQIGNTWSSFHNCKHFSDKTNMGGGWFEL